MPKRVIVDFDNTMGVAGCDLDDAMALLFLIGCDDVDLVGACTAFGNSSLETVHANTERLFAEWGLDIPVYRGAASAERPESDAARFMAQAAAENRGEIHVLALGSLTNLRGAALVDPGFFGNLAGVTLMGGITESLVINGRIMNELNISCDPAAAFALMSSDCPVAVATSQHCLPAFFRREDFERAFGVGSPMVEQSAYWFDFMDERYAWGGFTCWDVVAAAALARPDLFDPETMDVTLNERLFSVGYLEQAREGFPCSRIAVPRIADAESFVRTVLETWVRGCQRIGWGCA